ncbi:MAG: hypothetical protein GX067_08130, partial [Clostridiales bacterium]|nr:hypothetical protein [Clostridiales bacterium]
MKSHRFIALLLCAVMTATMLASCGDTPAAPADTSETATVLTEESETQEYIAPDVDYEGAEFCLAAV